MDGKDYQRGCIEKDGNRQSRAEANGPVGPAMAGPIIEPAILFFIIFFWPE